MNWTETITIISVTVGIVAGQGFWIGRAIDALTARCDRQDRRLDRLDDRFDRFETKLDNRFDRVEARLDRIADMLGDHGERIARLEAR